MTLERQNVVVIVGAVIAFILQIVVAPVITLLSAQPNFLLAYVLAVAIACPQAQGPVMPFILGLLYDLTGTGPVGGMALLFVVSTLAASRAFSVLDNDTLFMPVAIFAVVALVTEFVYGILLTSFGIAASPIEALLDRALPCALFDCVVGIVVYPIMVRLTAEGSQDRGLRTPRLR